MDQRLINAMLSLIHYGIDIKEESIEIDRAFISENLGNIITPFIVAFLYIIYIMVI